MKSASSLNLPVLAGVGVLALAIGFALARMTASHAPASAEPAAPASAATVADDVVKIPQAYLSTANISVEPVAAANIGATILAPGSVVAEPGSDALVVARESGNVSSILKQVGDSVKAGDVLARVSSSEGARIAAELRVARANVELARKNQQRDASLLQQGVLARQEAEASEAALLSAQAEAQRAATVAASAHVEGDGTVAVVSPIAGRISSANTTLGAFVEPTAPLFRVTGGHGIQIEAAVRASDTRRIQPGDAAMILRSNGQPLQGKVRSIAEAVDSATRAATVVVTPLDVDGLVIGDGVQLRLIAAGQATSGLSVPESAVQNIDGQDVLFVRTDDGFRAQPVNVGLRSGGMAEIISGVSAGTKVATRNAFLVKAEMKKSSGDDE
ncbi:efflux RND transporter periplasmic adaptor subunit [Pseudomonas aeruginosa]